MKLTKYRDIVYRTTISLNEPKIQKQKNSLKEYLDLENLSHSSSVRLGIFFENFFKETVKISPHCELVNLKSINIEGQKHQLDVVVANHKTELIGYFEIKSNLNLDSQKIKAIRTNVSLIPKHIKKWLIDETHYENYDVIGRILAIIDCKEKFDSNEVFSPLDFVIFCGIDCSSSFDDAEKSLKELIVDKAHQALNSINELEKSR